MAIQKIKIVNFKIFKKFELEFQAGMNILVGDNEAGKSTILEAIHLALTGIINGKSLNTELTQYLFNNEAVQQYLCSIESGEPEAPPEIRIELYFNECAEVLSTQGTQNNEGEDTCGVALVIALANTNGEYEELLKNGSIKTLPIEYYEARWSTFADKFIMPKSIPIKSALIDSSLARYQNGSDIYISRIVKQGLAQADIVKISQAHRNMRESFMGDDAIKLINEQIQKNITISNKIVELSVELLSKNAWENSLMTYIDKVPFQYIGKGEQCIIKTMLALADKKSNKASVILMEEPESHLTHTRLNQLIKNIADNCCDRQIIISTHSSFVANKLGLDNLILLSDTQHHTKISSLASNTPEFFKKLAGYDTLRLVLSKKAILVEGDSDELVVQRAYCDSHEGRLPIEDGIDVISVGTSFLRFLELAHKLNKQVAVITDNDGNIPALKKKYAEYLGDNSKGNILIAYDKNDHTPTDNSIDKYNYNTLENLIIITNNLMLLNTVFGTSYQSEDDLRKDMRNNKTEYALSIFESGTVINYPSYITEAIEYVSQ